MASLVRLDSKTRNQEQEIKAQAQRFDVEIVFKLSFAGQKLTAVPTLSACINLLDLDLSSNAITRIENLDSLSQLRRLNLSNNRITQLEGLSQLSKLECLLLHDNKLASIASLNLQSQLQPLTALRTLVLQQLFSEQRQANPCCGEAGYKRTVVAALPQLTNLDGERNPCTSSYSEYVHEITQAASQPPTRVEWPVPEVTPWLPAGNTDDESAQGQQEWSGDLGQDVEQERLKLVKSLDDCHMLFEVLTKEMEHTRALMGAPA